MVTGEDAVGAQGRGQDPVAGETSGREAAGGAGSAGRHRRHLFPGRDHVVKVLYSAQERAAVEQAAELAGLRPSSYVAVAALRMARQMLAETQTEQDAMAGTGRPGRARLSAQQGQELLAELVAARLALRRFGVNVNQAVTVLHTGGPVPVWLEQAVTGGERAVARVDAATQLLVRRLT